MPSSLKLANSTRIDDWGAYPDTWSVPNIRHLRVLDSVARNASIGQAAAEFGLSQPAVSQAIAKLEEHVGRSLFDRNRNGAYLTTVGDVFVQRVRRFLGQLNNVVDEIHAEGGNCTLARRLSSTQVRCLLAVAFSSSFAEAARSIGISAPALHRVARELEANCGIPLYQPTKIGLTLSPIGAELARRLGLAIREIHAAGDDIRYLDGIEAGSIVIGALPMSGDYLIGATIAELTSLLPEAHVQIITSPYGALMNSLRTGKIDMIFGALRPPHEASELNEEALFADPYCIVSRADHPLTKVSSLSTADILDYDWIVPGKGSARRRQYDALFHGTDQKPRAGVETSSISTIRSILCCSDRLAMVNEYEVETENRLHILKVIEPSPEIPSMAKGITTRADWLPTPVQKRFLAMLRTNASNRTA
ncbi:MAG: LysR family transcriptional regulator [Phyllobacterium sp.]